jgi:hypothetical protein
MKTPKSLMCGPQGPAIHPDVSLVPGTGKYGNELIGLYLGKTAIHDRIRA